MTELLEVLKEHFPAVERDLIVSGFHLYDVGTPKLSWAEFHSFVMAAPSTTATYESRAANLDPKSVEDMVAEMDRSRRGPTGKPPRSNQPQQQRPLQHPRRQEPLRNMRGQNLATHDPNKQITRPLAKADVLPLDQFRKRIEERNAAWAARPDTKPKVGEVKASNANS